MLLCCIFLHIEDFTLQFYFIFALDCSLQSPPPTKIDSMLYKLLIVRSTTLEKIGRKEQASIEFKVIAKETNTIGEDGVDWSSSASTKPSISSAKSSSTCLMIYANNNSCANINGQEGWEKSLKRRGYKDGFCEGVTSGPHAFNFAINDATSYNCKIGCMVSDTWSTSRSSSPIIAFYECLELRGDGMKGTNANANWVPCNPHLNLSPSQLHVSCTLQICRETIADLRAPPPR